VVIAENLPQLSLVAKLDVAGRRLLELVARDLWHLCDDDGLCNILSEPDLGPGGSVLARLRAALHPDEKREI
jgi:hypothetical protein